jgi:hypothetical protein
MKVSDIPFNPDCPEKVFNAAKKWLKDNYSRFTGTANFAIFDQDGEHKPRFAAACHSGIASPGIENRCVVATSNGRKYRADPLSPEQVEPFLRWFLYESYMGRFILNRDDFVFCRDYGFIVSADVYTPLMQNIMITSRHFKECHVRSFEKFNELVAAGVPGDLSYVVCFLSYWSYNSNLSEKSAFRNYGGHRASDVFNLPSLKLFMAGELGTHVGKIITDEKYFYRKKSEYNGGKQFFKKNDYNSTTFVQDLLPTDKECRERLSAYRKHTSSGEMYKPPNPFQRSFSPQPENTDPLDANYTEVFEVILPYMTEKKVWLS